MNLPRGKDWRPPRVSRRFVHVWRRNFLVWRKLAVTSVLGNLAGIWLVRRMPLLLPARPPLHLGLLLVTVWLGWRFVTAAPGDGSPLTRGCGPDRGGRSGLVTRGRVR